MGDDFGFRGSGGGGGGQSLLTEYEVGNIEN